MFLHETGWVFLGQVFRVVDLTVKDFYRERCDSLMLTSASMRQSF